MFPKDIKTRIESGAFRMLLDHLQERSDDVANIDVMIISGFCRNCLAKWLVMEARKVSKNIVVQSNNDTRMENWKQLAENLDVFGYDEAAEMIYGCAYPEWKARHAEKATNEQLQKYKSIADTPLVAHHDKEKLSKKTTLITTQVNNYFYNKFPIHIQQQLQAGVYQSLCQHLRDRNHLVSNMDLMTISGFCRNCLAKWLVISARDMAHYMFDISNEIIPALDRFGYDEAAEQVYGCTYPEWKKRYVDKATNEQLQKFQKSSYIHAKHNKEMLKKRDTINVSSPLNNSNIDEKNNSTTVTTTKNIQSIQSTLMSNVCCQDIDTLPSQKPEILESPAPASTNKAAKGNVCLKEDTKMFPVFEPPPFPKDLLPFKVGIITVSDRAYKKEYETGDLSGPAVKEALSTYFDGMTHIFSSRYVKESTVPDEKDEIGKILKTWCGKTDADKYTERNICDLIFTTGGTGFATRDVTPEATLSILDRECTGLMSYVSGVCSSIQPLASLSRGTAGICANTIIVNLPGNPRGVQETMNVLLPLLLHAIADIQN